MIWNKGECRKRENEKVKCHETHTSGNAIHFVQKRKKEVKECIVCSMRLLQIPSDVNM